MWISNHHNHMCEHRVCPHFAAITASTHLGRFYVIIWNATKALVKSGIDVGWEGLVCSQHSNSSQGCSLGLRSGLCAGHSNSSTPTLAKHVFMDPALCTGALSCWNRFGLGHSVQVKGNHNSAAHTGILDNCGNSLGNTKIWVWWSGVQILCHTVHIIYTHNKKFNLFIANS